MVSGLENRRATEPDADIVKRAASGDADAFETLLRQHSRPVFATVARRVPADAVEFVAQEVFVSAFRSLGLYEPDRPFEHWLLRIARRRCCDYWRKRRRNRETSNTALSDEQFEWLERASAGVSQDVFKQDGRRAETVEVVQHALGQLGPEDRTLIECIYFEELPLKEVAATLNWSLPKVKVRAFRARQKLRQIIERLPVAKVDLPTKEV